MHVQIIGRISGMHQKRFLFFSQGIQPVLQIVQHKASVFHSMCFLQGKDLFRMLKAAGGNRFINFADPGDLLVDFVSPGTLLPVILILPAVIAAHDGIILFVGQRHGALLLFLYWLFKSCCSSASKS